MDTRLVTIDSESYVECLPSPVHLESEADALELVAACGEHGTNRLMLHDENLPGEFYRLQSGLAGKLLLKFSNYRLRVAAVLPPEKVEQGRFREMALETNRGDQFRIFSESQAAEQWLLSRPVPNWG